MVSTRTTTGMEEKVEGLEQQFAEFRSEQGLLLESIIKQLEDLKGSQRQREPHGDDKDSHLEETGGGQRHNHSQSKGDGNRKIEITPFDRIDASCWLVRVDRFFRISGIQVGEKLEHAVLALHGEALTWFEWWETQLTFPTWLRFKQDLLKRFEPGAASNPLAPLLKVKEASSVMEYRRDFELAARPHKSLGNDTLLCLFHEGLKPTIKAEMAIDEFESLQTMMDRAMMLEARNMVWQEEGTPPWSCKGIARNNNWAKPNSPSQNQELIKSDPTTHTANEIKTPAGSMAAATSSGFKTNSRWILNEEWTHRQRKGLCFRCGDKWNPNHSCQFRNQQMVLLGEDDEVPAESVEEPSTVDPDLALQTLSLHLSSFNYWGLTSH